MLIFTTAMAAFSAVEFFEGAMAAVVLYVATKPPVRRPGTTKRK